MLQSIRNAILLAPACVLLLGGCGTSDDAPSAALGPVTMRLGERYAERELVAPIVEMLSASDWGIELEYSSTPPLDPTPSSWSVFTTIGQVPLLPTGVTALPTTVTVTVTDRWGRQEPVTQTFIAIPEHPILEVVELQPHIWMDNKIRITCTVATNRGVHISVPGGNPLDGKADFLLRGGGDPYLQCRANCSARQTRRCDYCSAMRMSRWSGMSSC
jgi:hypothetical protein